MLLPLTEGLLLQGRGALLMLTGDAQGKAMRKAKVSLWQLHTRGALNSHPETSLVHCELGGPDTQAQVNRAQKNDLIRTPMRSRRRRKQPGVGTHPRTRAPVHPAQLEI